MFEVAEVSSSFSASFHNMKSKVFILLCSFPAPDCSREIDRHIATERKIASADLQSWSNLARIERGQSEPRSTAVHLSIHLFIAVRSPRGSCLSRTTPFRSFTFRLLFFVFSCVLVLVLVFLFLFFWRRWRSGYDVHKFASSLLREVDGWMGRWMQARRQAGTSVRLSICLSVCLSVVCLAMAS